MISENLSFIEFLDNFGKLYPPSMQYKDGEDAKEWQIKFKNKLNEITGPLPERIKTEFEVLQTEKLLGYTRKLLKIRVSKISELIAFLLVPDNIKENEKRPGLIVSHGHARYGIDSICGIEGIDNKEEHRRAYALHAVQSGFVVLAPAWWGWNGRHGHVEQIRPNRDKCNVIQMAASMYGISVLALHIQDGMAAVDVLREIPEVDPEKIGCIGNSYGGRTTMWLTAFEPRIKACIVSGAMNTFREMSLKLSSCGIQYLCGILQYGDVPEVFSLIAPRPMQLQAGIKDTLLNEKNREYIRNTVEKIYKNMGAEQNLDYCLHEDGHIMLWDHALEFLNKYLPQ